VQSVAAHKASNILNIPSTFPFFMELIFWFVIYIVLGVFGASLIFNGLAYGAMYMRLDKKRLKKIIELGRLRTSMTVYDLGAGFGRIMLEAAKSGATVVGYEIDPLKVFWINLQIEGKFHLHRLMTDGMTGGLAHNPYKFDSEMIRTSIIRKNLLDADLSKADVVYCYLAPTLMQKLGDKASQEMKHGSKIITVEHKIPALKPIHDDPIDKIYVYRF
jgi:SAM-dependent methyltransferase